MEDVKTPEPDPRRFFHEFLPLVSSHSRDRSMISRPISNLVAAVEAGEEFRTHTVRRHNCLESKKVAFTGELCGYAAGRRRDSLIIDTRNGGSTFAKPMHRESTLKPRWKPVSLR